MRAIPTTFRSTPIFVLAWLLVSTALPVAAQAEVVPARGELLRINTGQGPEKQVARFVAHGDFRDFVHHRDPRLAASYLLIVGDAPSSETGEKSVGQAILAAPGEGDRAQTGRVYLQEKPLR
jgi:hypothetical protein